MERGHGAVLAGAGVWRSTFVMNIVAATCFAVLLLDRAGPGPTPPYQPAVIGALFVAVVSGGNLSWRGGAI